VSLRVCGVIFTFSSNLKQRLSSQAYSALGVEEDDPRPSPVMSSSTAASLSAVRVSFTDARAQSASSAYGDSYKVTAGNQNERLLMPSEMRGLGGGLSSSTLDDTRKFRWDKPSRIFRLQRGT